jgi:hypothetical protein
MPRTEFEEHQRAAQKQRDAEAVAADVERAAEFEAAQERLQPDIPKHMRGTLTVGEEPKHYIVDSNGKYHLANGPAPDGTTPPTFGEAVQQEVARQLAAAGLGPQVTTEGPNTAAAGLLVVDVQVPEGMGPRVSDGQGGLATSSLPKGVTPAAPKAARGKAAQTET